MHSAGRRFSPVTIHIFFSLLITVAVALIYSNTLDSSWHLDDFKQITGNTALGDPSMFLALLFSPKRGVTLASFAVNLWLGGLDVTGFHLVNISIHIVSSILLYFLLFLTFTSIGFTRSRAHLIAVASALLFAVHPVQTQAVTYITQRHESLSAMFCLLSLLFFALALRRGSRLARTAFFVAVPATYVLAFYSKEVAITLPALVLLYDLYFTRISGVAGLVYSRLILHAVMGALLMFFLVTTFFQIGGFANTSAGEPQAGLARSVGSVGGSVGSVGAPSPASKGALRQAKMESKPTAGFAIEGLGPRRYLLTEFNVVLYYIALLAVPVEQNIDYDFPLATSLFATPQAREGTRLIYPIPAPVVSLVILSMIVATAIYLLKRSASSRQTAGSARVVSFFIVWFLIVLSPTSSFIPIIDVIFEHRLYLASAGFFVTLVLALEWLCSAILGRTTGKLADSSLE